MELLNRRREMGSTDDCPYQKVEYLESTGTQWIDTNYTNSVSYFEIEFEMTKHSINNFLIGRTGSTGFRKYMVMELENKILYAEGNPLLTNPSLDEKYHIIYENGLYSIYDKDGNFINSAKGELTDNYLSIYLLWYYMDFFGYYKIHNFKLNDVMNLIPVRVGDKGMFYDTIGRRTFENEGSGEFIIGPDIN